MPNKTVHQKVFVKAKELVSLIEKMNLSLSEFANKCKISPSYFSVHLQNKREFIPSLRRRLMKQLIKANPELKWDDIFYLEGEEPIKPE